MEKNVENYDPEDAGWAIYDLPGNSFRCLVLQFVYTPTEEQRRVLELGGIKLRQYLPQNTYIAEVPKALDGQRLKQLGVAAVTALPPQFKMATDVYETVVPDHVLATGSDMVWVETKLLEGYASEEYLALVTRLGWTMQEQINEAGFVRLEGNLNLIYDLAMLPFIEWLAWPEPEPVPFNIDGYRRHGNGAVARATGLNLKGKGVTVGIGDGGYVAPHVDMLNRVTNLTQSNIASFGNHGDHVAGTVGGAGNRIWRHAGMAPQSSLLAHTTSSIWNQTGNWFNAYGMVLTNNSYGAGFACSNRGTYTSSSVTVDRLAQDYPAVLHVFAAGNDGSQTCAPYPQRYLTVNGSYTSSKNNLAVGALSTTGGLTGFSSRGPTVDGRIKPEICAIGSGLTSTIPTNNYGGKSGTSMAAPTVTGSLALLYEHFRKTTGKVNPDGRLIKGIALNTAEDLGNPGPDFFFGFGEMNTLKASEVITNGWYSTDTITQGQSQAGPTITVPSDVAELRVMIIWTDEPGASSAAIALVNDLDLTVSDPSGASIQPWVLDTAAANVGNTATRGVDHVNNVEQVTISNPVAGTYTPNIQGFNVPQGPQEYFLIYEIRSRSIDMLHPVGGEGLNPGTGVQIWWDADGLSGGNLIQEFSSDGGTTWSQLGTTNLTTRRRGWTPPNTPTHEARIRVRHSNGNTVAESEDFTILGEPGGLSITPLCRGYLELQWNAVAGADYYDVMLVDTMMKVVDTTSATSYTIGGLDPNQVYWLTVRARMNNGNPGPRTQAIQAQPNGTGSCPWPYDISVNTVTEPAGNGRAFSSSALKANENVRVSVQNNGSDTVSVIPLSYQVNGGTIVRDTMRFALIPGAVRAYNFSTAADLSGAGFHNVVVWSSVPADTFRNNDTAVVTVKQLANDTVFLPFSEGFEGSFPVAYLDTAFGLEYLDRVDFGSSDPTGRLRTDAGFGFPHTGNRALTLDVSGNVYCTNYASITVNMSAYSGVPGILMDFWYMHHSEESHPEDRVHIRGSENDSWIEVYNWYANRSSTGTYKQVTGIDMSSALTLAGQSFSSTTQIRIGQHDNFDASTISGTDGVTFDDFRIYFGTPPPFSLICPGNQQLFPFGTNCSANLPDFTSQVQIIGTGMPVLTQTPAPNTSISGLNFITIQGVLNGDTAICTFSVDLVPFTAFLSTTPVSCFGLQDGTATVFGTQGGRGDTYLWSNGDTTQTVTGLAPGPYSVTVTNSVGCSVTVSGLVSQPASIILNSLVNDESIPGANDGDIDLSVIGGTQPFTYNWAHGPTTEDVSNLAPGWYYVSVTDSSGCTQQDSAEVLAATASCFQETNGVVSMEAENFHRQIAGTGNTSNHLWSNYTDNNASNGRALQVLPNNGINVGDNTNGPRLDYQVFFTQTGTYTVYVRSKANGGADDSFHAGIDGVPATYGGTGLGRNNTTWGWASAVSGGGPNSVTINVATAGLHTFNIWMREDGAEIDKIILTQGSAPTGLGVAESQRGNCSPVVNCASLMINMQTTPETCAGFNDGQASVAVTGGGGNYTYWWSTGDTTTSVNNLAPNIYFFRVTHTGCPDSVMLVLIDQADSIFLNPAITHPTAPLAGNGSIVLSPSGGRQPYSVMWDNGDTSMTRTGLNQGQYIVTLIDSSGCSLTDTFDLVAPIPPVKFEYGTVTQVGEQWQIVYLQNIYDTMVIVATPILPSGSSDPVVARVRPRNDNQFEIRIQNPGGSTNDRYDVTWFVVEAGVYNTAQHGIDMEAHVVPGGLVSSASGWKKNPRSYGQNYTKPVVLGQVMSYADSNWSVFWSSAANNNVNAPTSSSFAAGYHVGQDANIQRQEEDLGIVVIEEGSGILQGVPFEAKLGADQILGVDNSALGYQYETNMNSRPVHAVLSSAGMDGGDGGWPVLFGFQPFSDSIFTLVIDEDQLQDNERGHTTEEVAYLAFGDTSIITTGPQLVGGRIDNVTEAWQTVSLPYLYRNMVVVASHILPNANSAPAVVRVRLTSNPNQFEVRLQRAGGGPVGPYTVYYFAAETGIYDAASGIKMEVRKINAPQPASTGNWNQRTAVSYGQPYQNPVVVGQVIGYNDTLWSNFWACSATSNTQAPNATSLHVGRHTGSLAASNRPAESLGYFVIESGSHTSGNNLFLAGLGGNSIAGVDNPGASPFYQIALPDSAGAAVVSTAGMKGNDGGWPVMWQSQPYNDHLYLAIDEDQDSDTERAHTTEQVGYFIWQAQGIASNYRIAQDVSTNWLTLYPNPASNEVTLRFPEIEAGSVVLINSIGQSILTKTINQQKSIKLNISDLAPGMYIVQVRGGDKPMQRSLIVRK